MKFPVFAQLNTNSSPGHFKPSTYGITPTSQVHLPLLLASWYRMFWSKFPSLIRENTFEYSALLLFCENPFPISCEYATHTSLHTWNVPSGLSCQPDRIFLFFQFTEHISRTFLMSLCHLYIIIIYILGCRSLRQTELLIFVDQMLKNTIQLNDACDKKVLLYEKKSGQKVSLLGPIVPPVRSEARQIT